MINSKKSNVCAYRARSMIFWKRITFFMIHTGNGVHLKNGSSVTYKTYIIDGLREKNCKKRVNILCRGLPNEIDAGTIR
jgi:hypothetical protein